MKLGLEGAKRVKKFFYRIPITVLQDTVKYDCFTIGGSNRNATIEAAAAGLSSRPAVASSSVPVYEPAVQPVASPSFAVDLNDGVGDVVGSVDILPNALQGVPPVGVGDGVLGDVEDDDVEPDMIEDDSGDEVGATEPALAVGGSSSGTQQYPPHFSSLDLDAMRQEGVSSIRRGVQYKVVESDHRRYVGKCSEFGNGCTWLIRLSLRKRKGIWEVKRYNGPHTCMPRPGV
ncbi:hypothetical protein Ahy_A02g005964 isoform F [Arachis hypogaea]|uniref:Transposase MuDR plant domain-containing protein n=1 Tax=Arachis hypogaea TaxID=3818 RepID=A0A445E8H5_ARAHY|nr:hypothetical protein Ahy_A02g005964 isoform F [Arachis hypogaea]